jgi:arylsulfatase A-like enzyme
VILIAIDTLRADRLSCYGHETNPPTSPAIDALAEDGIRFARVLASSNWTTPSFATVFTGLPASHHGVVHRASAIGPQHTTLAEHFQKNGWITHAIAYKTYLYNMGFEQGFDRWFNVPRIHVRARDNLAKAIAWLKQHHRKRFFLFLHFNDPHQPFNQERPFDRLYNRADALARYGLRLPIIIGPHRGVIGCDSCRENGKTKPEFKKLASRLYDGEVAYLDDRLGVFLQQLKSHGVYEDSLIVLFSDHGEVIYEFGEFYGHGSHRLDDEVMWVPLIIKPPAGAGIGKNQVVTSQVRLADLYPTLLELAGIPLQSAPEGSLSMMNLVRNPGAGRDRMAASENVKHHVLSLRHRDWMYALTYKPGKPIQEKLFRKRPYPTHGKDIRKNHPDMLRRFRLRALDFFLTHRPGKYLLVMGDDQTRNIRLRLEASKPLKGFRSFFGLSRTRQLRKSRFEVAGKTDSPILLFARLPERAKGTLELKLFDKRHPEDAIDTRLSLQELTDYVPGSIELIRKEKGISVHLFGNRHGKRKKFRRKTNPDTVEALRSLGYVE